MLFLLFVLLSVPIYSFEDERKHYGLSFHNHCGDYVKSFKCMTTCKMMGFQIFRMNFKCKCSCHDMKTSTILPFFKWRTNGTTKTVPKTQSPRLYDIIASAKTETEQGYTGSNFTCPTFYFPTATASNLNSTDTATETTSVAINSTSAMGGDKTGDSMTTSVAEGTT